MGARLIIVSNRVAVPDPAGAPLAGGMAVAVKAALKNRDGPWFGWAARSLTKPTGKPRTVDINKVTYVLIDLSKTDIQEYYMKASNQTVPARRVFT
jgi:trehalose 6-phosphate synthase